MVFNSITFLLYFLPAFLLLYSLLGKPYRKLVILSFSILFYLWGAPRFLFGVLISTVLVFYLVRRMDASKTPLHRKILLMLSALISTGMLLMCMCTGHFTDPVRLMMISAEMNFTWWTGTLIPLGISFFTFDAISYSIDVYRKERQPLAKLQDYLTYLLMFPRLIAGPIMPFRSKADQLAERDEENVHASRLAGWYCFVTGLAKIVLLAAPLGHFADKAFSRDVLHLSAGTAWLGMLALSFQIYFAFSGYTDMASGLGRMMGYRFPKNFDDPYVSNSLSDFWKRWNVSLNQWMKLYLLTPLACIGRTSAGKSHLVAGTVFGATVLWYGASWNVFAWGAFHGFWLVAERIWLNRVYEYFKTGIPQLVKVLWVFAIVAHGWVFFRAESVEHALEYLRSLWTAGGTQTILPDNSFAFTTLLCIAGIMLGYSPKGKLLHEQLDAGRLTARKHLIIMVCTLILFALCISKISTQGIPSIVPFRF
ncbi:MAG: Peptidoglycan O-acetyltransferase [Saprospiraceae bacterium]|nr:Peptidoglycan O-acetyltransferase [Saprospiraceae bacterium]